VKLPLFAERFVSDKNLNGFMKKFISGLLLLAVIIIIAFYYYIPTTQNLDLVTEVSCTETGAARQILYKDKWAMWWPGKKAQDNVYTYKDFNYRIDKIKLNGIETTIFNDEDSLHAFFQFSYDAIDTCIFQWSSTYQFAANPIKRFHQYRQLNNFKNNVASLLLETKKYFDEPVNIYGMKVIRETVKEAHYLSTKNTFTHYPTTAEIYEMIESIKAYLATKGNEENGEPMLHVEKEGEAVYETLVAIPTKTALPAEGKFQPKKMILGFILKGEIKGGPATILKGEKEMANYIIDYKKMSPAIPFQTLVTNRLQQPDTTKWITHLYYPIFI
jgi:hypothetical protein